MLKRFCLILAVALFSTGLPIGTAKAVTLEEVHNTCKAFEASKFKVKGMVEAYCAGYFQGQIQTGNALCRTLTVIYRHKAQHREMLLGVATLFGTSAKARDYAEVIGGFNKWAKNHPEYSNKNPSIYVNEYLTQNFPCDPTIDD